MDERPAFVSHSTFDEYAGNYDEALNQGLALSGEGPDYFASLRIDYTARWLARLGVSAARVSDFGCGIGNSMPHFQRHFPEAGRTGFDLSAASIQRATDVHGDRAAFRLLQPGRPAAGQDLVYCNGVFHHIPPADRGTWARHVYAMLRPGGLFALWENNPWNPGTRMVMRRIPFDRDAVPLSPTQAKALLRDAGFAIVGTRFRFYFPRPLRLLRPLERFGERVPLGAQYCVLARRRADNP